MLCESSFKCSDGDRVMRIARALAGCVLLFFSSSLTARAHADEPEIEFKPDVEFGTGGEQKLTLHLALPKTDGAKAGLLFIHGGGWAAGNKDDLKDAIREAAKKG